MSVQPREHDFSERSLRLRSLAVFFVALAVGVLLWVMQEQAHQAQLDLEVEVTAEQAGKRLSDWVEDRMNLSRYLARKWEDDYRDNTPQYRKDAAEFVASFPGFQAINWIDPDGVIRVVVPLEGNEAVVDADLSKNPLAEVREAVRRARVERRPTRTPASISLMQGGRGFATYWPIFDEQGVHTGYINTVFRVNEFIEQCLSRIQGTNRFLIAIREQGGDLVYPVGTDDDYLRDLDPVSFPIIVVDQPWELYMAPSSAFYQNRPFDVHHLILPLAVALGIFLAALDRVQSLRKRALHTSEAQYKKLFEQAPIGYFSVRPNGIIDAVNLAAEALTGWPRNSMIGKQIIELFSEAGSVRDGIREQLARVRAGEQIRVEESQMYRRDRLPFWVLVSVEGVYDDGQILSQFRLTIRDISQRKEAEEARSSLSAAIEQAEEGMVITGAGGAIQYANPAFFRSNRQFQKRIQQKPLTDVLLGEGVSREVVDQVIKAMISKERWKGSYSLRGAANERVQVVATLSPLRDAGRITNFVLIQRDVTHEEELRSQLLQAQKLEAIGRFAGGIAHDFNNILQSLLGYVTLARRSLEEPGEVDHCLEEIERSGLRAAELIAHILAFGRKTEDTREPVWLASMVREVMDLLRGAIPSHILLESDFGGLQRPVIANPTQIHQVLMNLASNAQHAMPSGKGTIAFRVSHVDLGESENAHIPGLAPGSYMRLSVADTGTGMSPEVVERVFEPYFTTRDHGRGSGLGLATVHGLVEAHHGAIQVESRTGKGTTFHVYLPVANDELPALPSDGGSEYADVPAEESDASTLSENDPVRLLYVDDEKQIVDSMCRLLVRLGFLVTGHSSSTDALAAFRETPDAFDVVVTDLSMPDMNGIAMARELNAIRSGVPIILCSGYGDTHNQEIEENEFLIKAYLEKPVSISRLHRTIDEVRARNKK